MPATSEAAWTASRARAWSSVKESSALVGRLAPDRPRPTRAGVSCRRSASEWNNGAGAVVMLLFGGNGSLAQPDRIVRRVLPAGGGCARERNQMVRDQRRRDQTLDVAALDPP